MSERYTDPEMLLGSSLLSESDWFSLSSRYEWFGSNLSAYKFKPSIAQIKFETSITEMSDRNGRITPLYRKTLPTISHSESHMIRHSKMR